MGFDVWLCLDGVDVCSVDEGFGCGKNFVDFLNFEAVFAWI